MASAMTSMAPAASSSQCALAAASQTPASQCAPTTAPQTPGAGWSEAPPKRECAVCGAALVRAAFSRRQWDKPSHEPPSCRPCLNARHAFDHKSSSIKNGNRLASGEVVRPNNWGYSLYLDGGVPHFAVRDGEELFELATDRALDPEESVHLAGTLDAEGVLRLWVDGREEASAPGRVLSRRPSDPLNLGSDAESAVGRYEAPAEFAGELEEVRLYWGVLDANALRDWARP